MKENKSNNNEIVSVEEGKKKNVFTSAWGKTVDFTKKAAEGLQKGTQELIEQTKKNMHEQKVKKLNPLFPEDFKNEKFHLPNVIEIVDDAVRRDIDVCEGAIGWIDRVADVEVLHLYDEWVEESGIQFVPVWKCDNVYCVDNFERNRYVNVNAVFAKATEEKLAELENIAYCLGARSCSIEILEENKEIGERKIQIKAVDGEISLKNTNINKQSGKTVVNFVGHDSPRKPKLKWFTHDDGVNGLISMRCNDIQSVTSKILKLSGASCATMNRKIACAIDKIFKVGGKASMEQQVKKEHSSTLIFEIQF